MAVAAFGARGSLTPNIAFLQRHPVLPKPRWPRQLVKLRVVPLKPLAPQWKWQCPKLW